MVFSSSVFLIFFLPIVVIGYYLPFIGSRKYKNVFLLAASLGFYAYGEPVYVCILLFSIVYNWFMGRMIGRREKNDGKRKTLLFWGVFVNLLFLFCFKYLNFTIWNLNYIFGVGIPETGILLPIGISFYTFQAISYLADIYTGKAEAQKSVLDVGVYIALFPQLVAGPIVRYDTIAKEIHERKESYRDAYEGIHRFIIGIGKKILLADRLAVLADRAFSLPASELSAAMAWLGAGAYTMQVFFDFSAYSDMAIGLGKIFGFHFMENFDYPYVSKTITEFWRRWHISLGSWFRDYVYIPLGGNRRGRWIQVRNLLIVWGLTGLWHGANWTFLLWGLLQFLVLFVEKATGYARRANGLGRLYVIPVFLIGWSLFRAETVSGALSYLAAMFGGSGIFVDKMAAVYCMNFLIWLILGLWFCIPHQKLHEMTGRLPDRIRMPAAEFVYAAVFLVSFAYIIRASYSPFIYFNF
ncbi:MAG: MBOAT family protein [Lachnospiraceae bacterium]|nr:MBOAT family protein [Lachnospiraceae bacterium]